MSLFPLERIGDVHFSIFQANKNSSPNREPHFKMGQKIILISQTSIHLFLSVTLIHKIFEVYK